MKKLLLSIIVTLSLFQVSLAYPTDWNPMAPCGWDFEKSTSVGVPFIYCWARQDRGDILFSGKLKTACSGSSCSVANHIN